MARKTEPEGVLAEFEEWLPKGMAELYYALWLEVASLNVSWNSYIGLYGSGDKRIELLNYTAPSFFGFLEPALLGDSLLSIMRLTDPPGSGKRKNLTFHRLPGKLQDLGHAKLGRKVTPALSSLMSAVKPIRNYRNKWLSHRDLKVGLKEGEKSWGFSRDDVGQIIHLINGILNLIELDIRNTETRFADVIEHGGVDHLLFALEEARRAEVREKEEALGRLQR